MTTKEDEQIIFSSISRETATAVERGISARIEKEENDILENKEGGFWGFLKSLIFSIAKAFGFEGVLAKMFGMPIPEKNEIQTMSAQTGNATAQALTDKNFTFSDRKEFEEKLEAKIAAGISPTESLNGDKVAEIAHTAAQAASKRFDELFDAQGNRVFTPAANLSPVETLAAKTFNDSLTKELKSNPQEAQGLAQLVGMQGDNPQLSSEQINALATALGPKLSTLKARQGELEKTGDKVFDRVSGELQAALNENKALLEKSGMKFGDDNTALLSHKLAGEVVKGIGINTPMPAAFAEATKNKEMFFATQKAASMFVDALSNDTNSRQKLATLVGKNDLQSADIRAIAAVLAPTIAQLKFDKDSDKLPDDPKSYAVIAAKLNGVLQQNSAALNTNGMAFDKDGLQIFANEATKQLAPKLGITSPPAADFIKSTEALKQQIIKETVQKTIQKNTPDGVVEATAVAVYSESWGFDSNVKAMKPYYDKGEDGKYHRNSKPDTPELKEAQHNLYDYAVKNHYTLNEAQSKKVAEIVAKTANEYINDRNQLDKTPKGMADALNLRVSQALNTDENKKAINDLSSVSKRWSGTEYQDNTLEIMSYNLNGRDVLNTVAEGIADNVEKNVGGSYDQITAARDALNQSKKEVVNSAAADVKNHVAATGVKGGTEAQMPLVSNLHNGGSPEAGTSAQIS